MIQKTSSPVRKPAVPLLVDKMLNAFAMLGHDPHARIDARECHRVFLRRARRQWRFDLLLFLPLAFSLQPF